MRQGSLSAPDACSSLGNSEPLPIGFRQRRCGSVLFTQHDVEFQAPCDTILEGNGSVRQEQPEVPEFSDPIERRKVFPYAETAAGGLKTLRARYHRSAVGIVGVKESNRLEF